MRISYAKIYTGHARNDAFAASCARQPRSHSRPHLAHSADSTRTEVSMCSHSSQPLRARQYRAATFVCGLWTVRCILPPLSLIITR